MTTPRQIPIEFQLLGQADFESTLQLQSRLQREVFRAAEPKTSVLFVEHPRLITIGRDGSRAHVRWTDEHLQRRRLKIRWVARRGGCVVHAPGQLGVYIVSPLEELEIAADEFQQLTQTAVLESLRSLGLFPSLARPGALVGRTGVLATTGVAVTENVTGFGAYINVHPDLADFGYVDSGFPNGEARVMTSLVSETRSAGKMSGVRSALIESLSDALNSPRYHIVTGRTTLPRAS